MTPNRSWGPQAEQLGTDPRTLTAVTNSPTNIPKNQLLPRAVTCVWVRTRGSHTASAQAWSLGQQPERPPRAGDNTWGTPLKVHLETQRPESRQFGAHRPWWSAVPSAGPEAPGTQVLPGLGGLWARRPAGWLPPGPPGRQQGGRPRQDARRPRVQTARATDGLSLSEAALPEAVRAPAGGLCVALMRATTPGGTAGRSRGVRDIGDSSARGPCCPVSLGVCPTCLSPLRGCMRVNV